jgi:antitoxin VapB
MQTAKIFKNGKSQAVRLPKEFRFEGDEVFIKKQGNSVILTPKEKPYANLLAAMGKAGPDFMVTRDQGKFEKRAKL